MSKSFKKKETNPFEEGIKATDADAEIYGKVDIPDSGRVVTRPTDINLIRRDPRQPRRPIPTIVSGYWDGNPDETASVLLKYQEFAEKESHRKLHVAKAIEGREALIVEDGDGPLYSGFAKLVTLAAAIYNEGLTNPITVVKISATQYQVETGERRWLAHHLLSIHINPKKYAKIAAREVDYDPFRQASENNSREGYNAIEMARQIAILIMEARSGIDGMKYDKFEDMVLAGECDRKFYAQIANGYIHKIPDGLGDKIVNATGLSLRRISQYRSLLRMTDDESKNDELWVEADTQGYTEFYIRESLLPSLKPAKESGTAVEHSPALEGGFRPDNTPSQTRPPHVVGNDGEIGAPNKDAFGRIVPPPQPSPFKRSSDSLNYVEFAKSFINKSVRMAAGQIGKVTDSEGSYVFMVNDGSDLPLKFHVSEIIETLPDPAQHDVTTMDLTGKKVRLRNGIEGKVTEHFGEKLMFLKTGESIAKEIYRSAVASVITGGDESPATESPKADDIKVGDRVRVNFGSNEFTGEVRYIRDGSGYGVHPYGVYSDHSKSTHYYPRTSLTLLPKEDDSNNPPSTKEEETRATYNPQIRLVRDSHTLNVISQLAILAKILDITEAESSLLMLREMTLGGASQMGYGLDGDSLNRILANHYQAIAVLGNQLMQRVESVLSDIADINAAERQGE